VPAASTPRRFESAPTQTSSGAPKIGHHSGSDALARSISPGKRRASARCSVWSKIAPVGAAS
jgi:hypothetical protein